jgi:hypothetical protein
LAEKTKRTNEEKEQIKKSIRTGLLAAIALAAVVCVIVFYFKTASDGNEPSVIKEDVKDLKSITLSDKSLAMPYVTTGIDKIVYTADSAGNIVFYEFNGTEYVQTAETGTIDVNVPLSGQQIPVKVHYIEREGKIAGFGVFTSSNSTDVYIYDFMLVKITNLPAGYEQDGKLLMLANTDIENVYSLNPIWEEAYVVSRDGSSVSRFFIENNRTLDMNGAMRSDFSTVTDKELSSTTGNIPFFSARSYDTLGAATDIYVKTPKGESEAVKGVLDTYAKPTDDGGFIFVKETNGGFEFVKYLNGTQTTVSEFFSQYGEEYIRSGDYVLCKEDGRIYTTYDETVIELPDFKMNPSQFVITSDGKYIVLAGTVTNATDYQIYIYNTQTKKAKTFADSDFSVHYSLFCPTNETVCFYTQSANGYDEKIINLAKIA